MPDTTKCPVCGGEADPSISAEYKGKTYNFCCEDCKAKFNEDPEQYADKSE